jgi:hypothetical protein
MSGNIVLAFEHYHAQNPKVYHVFVRLAREYLAATGRSRIGIKALIERARWELAITTSANWAATRPSRPPRRLRTRTTAARIARICGSATWPRTTRPAPERTKAPA